MNFGRRANVDIFQSLFAAFEPGGRHLKQLSSVEDEFVG